VTNLDFFTFAERSAKGGAIEIRPDWKVLRSYDLMVRGKTFYAIWDEEKGLWSTDEYDVQRLVDKALDEYRQARGDGDFRVKYLRDFSSGMWSMCQTYIRSLSDNSHDLDTQLTFANTPVRKEQYASRRLPYALEKGDISSYEELISTLYDPGEREKIEWAIGSIVAGDSRYIQKFVVLYGEAGSGKSTILNVISQLFEGYTSSFDARALASPSATFAMEVFKDNPLVAIQHDGDLSRIEDNARINSIVSHEDMTMNEKFKATYTTALNAMLWMGTNRPVKITDAKSGIIRRLIDVTPSGRRLDPASYNRIMRDIPSELGAIAHYCLEQYKERGFHYFDAYRPTAMMRRTDLFYNFVVDNQEVLAQGVALQQGYAMYKAYLAESGLDLKMSRYRFRDELANYFEGYHDRVRTEDGRKRNWFEGLRLDRLDGGDVRRKYVTSDWLEMSEGTPVLDDILSDRPAQYASDTGAPLRAWADVSTVLKDLDTSRLHYVRPEEDMIVIDLDLRGNDGAKSFEANRDAARELGLPETYAEVSKSGAGIHLHYRYAGDVSELANEISPQIEVKTFRGRASLRRMGTLSNGLKVATISEGLPKKRKERDILTKKKMGSEKALRELIERNLRKEIHPGTKPSMDFIKKVLDDAYESGMEYDVENMRGAILAFAMQSTHQKDACFKIYTSLRLKSSDDREPEPGTKDADGGLVFYDVEVYPNLFLVCWMRDDPDADVAVMVNPRPEELESMFEMKLVGYNNKRYDNHILYARWMGYDTERLFHLSQRIVSGDRGAFFRDAYDASYTDTYDFCATKQSLKKWEIELNLPHKEMDIPWDQPVQEADVPRVIEYCKNDVRATREVFHHNVADWEARQTLAKMAGLNVNSSTNQLTQQIIFGNDRKPPFVHTDLSEQFPGYKYENGKSTYRGEEVGEGGWVYAEPGYYTNVALLDVASMHPHSLIALKCFGEKYTARFQDIVKGRMAVKHHDVEAAKRYLGEDAGALIGQNDAALAFALKIAINSVYGLTAAKFPTRANGMDPANNPDNIVAKRGALFMVDLKNFIQEKGFTVAHIKTDSVKIPNATSELIAEVMEFGKKYGYTFEHEATYDKMVLVNDAVYVAHDKDGWHATGAQFQHPFVFKSIFGPDSDPVYDLKDYVETRQTHKGTLYLNYGTEDNPQRAFVGRIGSFVPVKENAPGGILEVLRDDKYYSAPSSKGYRWILEEDAARLDRAQIDDTFALAKAAEAVRTIEKYVPMEELLA
jgi:energy-coupling factor transporter ATP-binding protein EcfA2